MFATHPSLATHFEPPTFSPGVPSRELRNRLKLLEHANNAGLIPKVEWELICKAVKEQVPDDTDMKAKACESTNDAKQHTKVDPFRYLATTTRIHPTDDGNNTGNTNENKSKKRMKKKHWLEYKTTSLIPISPDRKGSAEDISLPYSMELWRKAKTLNRDRSVLGCTLAHLIAMKKLVGENDNGDLDGGDGDGGFDFILEDNVRAFVGIGEFTPPDGNKHQADEDWTGWSCECANRIWDTIEASNDAAEKCHMRYYGWLGSLQNLNWVYNNHSPRSGFNSAPSKCTIFPFPTNDDFALDAIDPTAKSDQQNEKLSNGEQQSSQTPQFTTPGGTAVWGAFAYTISPAAYHTFISQLQNDVGSLVWKGKRMRAYQAKPIDKILPRHVKSAFGPRSLHLPDKVAFVRAPMLGSLLHPQWEEGFCGSTELQYQLSCSGEESNPTNGSDVWDCVWLTDEERQVVSHRKKSGHWLQKGDLEKETSEEEVS